MAHALLPLLLLSVLLGSLPEESRALQAGFQYVYKYSGTTFTSIQNGQSSGSALRATVALQLTQNGAIFVKAGDFEVGEVNGGEICEATKETEITYREMDPQDSAHLVTPFLVHVNSTEVTYIEVPQEPVWVTNIRRGIINTIPLIPLKGLHPPRLTFGIKEDTMIGTCFNWYSMLTLPSYQAKIEERKQESLIEVDAQRETGGEAEGYTSKSKGRKTSDGAKGRKTSHVGAEQRIPTIQDTLSILTRTLDTDQCNDKLFTIKINGNNESLERTQRTSAGTFLIRGEGTALRLEHGQVSGNLVIYTGESPDEYIKTTTKQLLILRQVLEADDSLAITYVAERRTVSFSVADGLRPTMKEKLLGFSPDGQQIQANMAGIKEDIRALVDWDPAAEENRPHFLSTFQRLVERLTILSWSEVEELITHIASTFREKEIIYQAFLASGRDEVLSGLIDKMKNRSFRRSQSLLFLQVFEAATTPVRNPALLPAMLEVVSDMGEDEQVSKAASLLNLAKLANRLCLNPHTANTCDPDCNTDFILNTLLPVLSRGLQEPVKWKRLLNVQAMCFLGSPYSIDFLQPIIEGTNNDDTDIRLTAIYCLTSDLLPKTTLEMVFNTLVPLINNPTEIPEVRSVAFIVLTTWEPDLSWWEHVALSTWKETSNEVLSFISSAITSLSDGSDPRSKNAKKVVHLVKHPRDSKRVSLARSAYLYLDEIIKNCKVKTGVKVAWLASAKSSFPRSIFYHIHLVTTMGVTQIVEGGLFTNIGKFLYEYYHPGVISLEPHEESMTFREIFEELKEDLDLPIDDTSQEKFFSYLLVSNPVPLILALYSGNEPFKVEQNLFTLLLKTTLQKVPVHIRLADSTLVVPSEVGLPVVIKHEEDFAFTAGANVTEIGRGRHTITISLTIKSRNSVRMDTLVPWSQGLAIGAGVDAGLEITLPPMKIDYHGEDTTKLVWELLPLKVNIISRLSFIYTSLTPLYHVVDSILPSQDRDYTKHGRRLSAKELYYHGINKPLNFLCVEQHNEGADHIQPQDFFNFLSNMTSVQLQYKTWKYKIVLDPEICASKGVTFTFKGDVKEKENRFTDQVRGGDQQKQGAEDYDMFSQVSQTSSAEIVGLEPGPIIGGFDQGPAVSGFDQGPAVSGFDQGPTVSGFDQGLAVSGFDQGPGDGEQAQHSHVFTSHLAKMEAMMMPPTAGGKVYTLTITMDPHNAPRKYEIAITLATSRGSLHDKIATTVHKIHVLAMTRRRAGSRHPPSLSCLDVRMETPLLLPLMTKKIVREINPEVTLLMSLYHGNNCNGPAILKVESSVDVSSEGLRNMPSVEERDACDPQLPTQNYPFYDRFTSTFTAAEEVPRRIGRTVAEQLGITSPNFRHNDVSRPDNEVTVEMVINTEGNEMDFKIIEPRITISFPLPVSSGPSIFTILNPDDLDKVCHLTEQSVRTFDGMLHSFEPSSCWTTVAIVPQSDEHSSISRYRDVAVQVRFDEQWEVRITSPTNGVVLDVTRSDIMVNEEEFSGQSDRFVVQHFRDSQQVGIGDVGVRVGDTVDIMLSELYRNSVTGLCGNYDGEQLNDMTGPTGCLYTDPAFHTSAWNTRAQGCSRFTIRNAKRQLEEYRDNCDKVVFQPTGVSQHNAMTNCTEWKYDARDDATGLTCKSKVPTAACRPGCHPGAASTKFVEYNCLMPSVGEGEVQYGENHRCFTTVSPIAAYSACYHL